MRLHTYTCSSLLALAMLVPAATLVAQEASPATSSAATDMSRAAPGETNIAEPTTTTAQPADNQARQHPDTYQKERLSGSESYSDFVVGPGRFELEIAPGESKTVELMVTNRMGDRRLFSFAIEDMVGSEPGESDSTIKLLGEQTGPYTIRDFISVPHEKFYLDNNERARIPVTISLPPDAEPGGRYGSLLTSIVSNRSDRDDTPGAQPASTIVSRVGTLFFVTTPGDIVRDSELKKLTTENDQRLFWSGPIMFNLTSENYGSVHTTPYGMLTVTNMLGEEVGSVELQPWFVMPESLRTREIEWNRDFLIGRYTATAEINRGYDDIVDVAEVSFWVIPWKIIAVVFGGLFLFFWIARSFFSRFELKRK